MLIDWFLSKKGLISPAQPSKLYKSVIPGTVLNIQAY